MMWRAGGRAFADGKGCARRSRVGHSPSKSAIRDHIATSLSIAPDHFECAPFSQRGGLGKAHQLSGGTLPALLDEPNTVLAA